MALHAGPDVCSGLHRLDPATADRFARQPDVWAQGLGDTLALPAQDDAPGRPVERRRRLVRRGHLSPQEWPEFRAAFNRGGFEVVDGPPTTSVGKTGTDIHRVLDIVDLLQRPVHCDGLIVFSADADFTPVLRKLRRWNRRTSTPVIGFPPAAYRRSVALLLLIDRTVADLAERPFLFSEPARRVRDARCGARRARRTAAGAAHPHRHGRQIADRQIGGSVNRRIDESANRQTGDGCVPRRPRVSRPKAAGLPRHAAATGSETLRRPRRRRPDGPPDAPPGSRRQQPTDRTDAA